MKSGEVKKVIRNGIEIELERVGNAMILSSGDAKLTWTPHPKTGRTKEEFAEEFEQALAAFAAHLAGHSETGAHLDDLMKE